RDGAAQPRSRASGHLEISSALRLRHLRAAKAAEFPFSRGERPTFAGRPWGGEILYMDMCAEKLLAAPTRRLSCTAWSSRVRPEEAPRPRRRGLRPHPRRARMLLP